VGPTRIRLMAVTVTANSRSNDLETLGSTCQQPKFQIWNLKTVCNIRQTLLAVTVS